MIYTVLTVSTVPAAVTCPKQPRCCECDCPETQLHCAPSYITIETPQSQHTGLTQLLGAEVWLCPASLSSQQRCRCSPSQLCLCVLILGGWGRHTVLRGCPAISQPVRTIDFSLCYSLCITGVHKSHWLKFALSLPVLPRKHPLSQLLCILTKASAAAA